MVGYASQAAAQVEARLQAQRDRPAAQPPPDPGYRPGLSQRHPGPRHDNDHEDVRAISIAPTPNEVLCDEPPFLPKARYGNVGITPLLTPFGITLTYTWAPCSHFLEGIHQPSGRPPYLHTATCAHIHSFSTDLLLARSPGSSFHLVDTPLEAYRDRHFRLLRYDATQPLTDAVQELVRAGGLAELQRQVSCFFELVLCTLLQL